LCAKIQYNFPQWKLLFRSLRANNKISHFNPILDGIILWQLSAYDSNVNNGIKRRNCFCLQWDTMRYENPFALLTRCSRRIRKDGMRWKRSEEKTKNFSVVNFKGRAEKKSRISLSWFIKRSEIEKKKNHEISQISPSLSLITLCLCSCATRSEMFWKVSGDGLYNFWRATNNNNWRNIFHILLLSQITQ
jgi:hypothetical protein